jgi:hypothetical protein
MAMLMAVALLGAGCGGINASQSVSPASFFLPGLMKAGPPSTNSLPVVQVDNSTEIASVR